MSGTEWKPWEPAVPDEPYGNAVEDDDEREPWEDE